MQAKPNALPWLALSAVVIVLDQLTKAWVLSSLPEYQPIPVIEGFWNWYRTYNTGAAFSFLSDAGGWQQYFFIVLAFAICGLLAFWLAPFVDELRFLLISGDVQVIADDAAKEIGVVAAPTQKAKCVRCWHHRADVGLVDAHPQLCGRCVSNVEGEGESRSWF